MNNILNVNFFISIISCYTFVGLEEIESTCKNLNIQFHFLIGCGKDILPSFVERHKFGAVIIDFCPLRIPLSWAEDLSHSLPRDVPLIQVFKRIIYVIDFYFSLIKFCDYFFDNQKIMK